VPSAASCSLPCFTLRRRISNRVDRNGLKTSGSS
jgi:hypothetical protein